jgi:hypothetical protein
MVINGRNQLRENSTRDSAFMLKEISTLSLIWDQEDILISLTTETWSSRLKMDKELKFGISTKELSPSRLDSITNHGILDHQEEPMICKSGAPTQDGGKSSLTLEATSKTSRTRRCLMYQVEKMPKDKKLFSGKDITDLTRDGELFMLIKQRRS